MSEGYGMYKQQISAWIKQLYIDDHRPENPASSLKQEIYQPEAMLSSRKSEQNMLASNTNLNVSHNKSKNINVNITVNKQDYNFGSVDRDRQTQGQLVTLISKCINEWMVDRYKTKQSRDIGSIFDNNNKQEKTNSNMNANRNSTNTTSIQQLYQKNQHYTQCLKDFTTDIIHYTYIEYHNTDLKQAHNSTSFPCSQTSPNFFHSNPLSPIRNLRYNSNRKALPKCLVGYYQFVKNLVWMYKSSGQSGNTREGETNQNIKVGIGSSVKKLNKKIAKPTKSMNTQVQQISPPTLPAHLIEFSSKKLFRILLSQSPMSYIHDNVTKLEDTILVDNFKKQLASYIRKRFKYFCRLYSLGLAKGADSINGINRIMEGIVSYFMRELLYLDYPQAPCQQISPYTQNQAPQIPIPIDQLFLCLVYIVYRINNYKILLSYLVDIYQRQCEIYVDRQQLLEFYNGVFIIRLFGRYGVVGEIEVVESSGRVGADTGDAGQGFIRHVANCKDACNEQQDMNISIQMRNSVCKSRVTNKIIVNNRDQNQGHQNAQNYGFNSNPQLTNSGRKITNSIFRMQQVKQQKSIYDMFQ